MNNINIEKVSRHELQRVMTLNSYFECPAGPILNRLGVVTPDGMDYTMFVTDNFDGKIVCKHNLVEDAVIRYKSTGKWTRANIFGCRTYCWPAENWFEKGDLIEEVKKYYETITHKEDYTGKAYILSVLDDQNHPLFKVVYCEKIKRQELI